MKKRTILTTALLTFVVVLVGVDRGFNSGKGDVVINVEIDWTTPNLDLLFVEGSVYHAVESQTDPEPTVTASGIHIRSPTNPPRIVAVPQSWIRDGTYEFGDTITVLCNSCILQGDWIIEDVMNKRYDYPNDCRVDFLISTEITTGLYEVKIIL